MLLNAMNKFREYNPASLKSDFPLGTLMFTALDLKDFKSYFKMFESFNKTFKAKEKRLHG